MTWDVIEGDCLDVMATLADCSVDAIITDPPYFRVKGEAWDRQWGAAPAFLAWLGTVADEWRRLLRPNGSLYVFASPRMAARVECMIGERFNVLNRIRWVKAGWHNKAEKEALRSFLSPWEEIVFAEHHGTDSMALGESGYAAQCEALHGFVFEPLRAYLDGERKRAGIDKAACSAALGFRPRADGMVKHYFNQSQWCLPTREHYAALQRLFNAGGIAEDLRREYEDLRQEYEGLRRPFAVTAATPYTDVWNFAPVMPYPGKHPCEKPQTLLRHILAASTRPGAVVLDCFAGTGSMALACRDTGRAFIGIEQSADYCAIARRRIANVAAQPALVGVA
jgi:adenine-specific DNA-methyltransferase